MIVKEFIMMAPDGIHARPATMLLKLAKKYKSEILLRNGEKTVGMKSMIDIMTLSAKYGDKIILTIDGEDENTAANALEEFFSKDLLNV